MNYRIYVNQGRAYEPFKSFKTMWACVNQCLYENRNMIMNYLGLKSRGRYELDGEFENQGFNMNYIASENHFRPMN